MSIRCNMHPFRYSNSPLQMIEVERRFSNSLPLLELDPGWVDRILELVLKSGVGEGDDSGYPLKQAAVLILGVLERKPIEDAEEKAVARLGIAYGVLRRLGFTESRVEECLQSISSVDLDEAYDWVRDPRMDLVCSHAHENVAISPLYSGRTYRKER